MGVVVTVFDLHNNLGNKSKMAQRDARGFDFWEDTIFLFAFSLVCVPPRPAVTLWSVIHTHTVQDGVFAKNANSGLTKQRTIHRVLQLTSVMERYKKRGGLGNTHSYLLPFSIYIGL